MALTASDSYTMKSAVSYDALKKEADGLTGESLGLLIDIAAFLKKSSDKSWRVSENPSGISIVVNPKSSDSTTNSTNGSTAQTSGFKRKLGFMADSFVSIAPDFDTCLDGLEEYV